MTVAERAEPSRSIGALGVTDDELDAIRDRLGGRDPNDLELAMFSVMWSEHCSYKSSKPLLRTLPTAGEGVVAGPGENAGRHLDRRRAGGRVQDRVAQPPVAPSSRTRAPRPASAASCATSSRWAPGRSRSSTRSASATRPTPRTRHLVDGVVRGVGGYGNCVGVPTVGGELVFDPSYAGNPLVNVMAIGLLEERLLTLAAAPGPGQPRRAVRLGDRPRRDRRRVGPRAAPRSPTTTRRSGRRSRSATRSPRSCSSRRASSSSSAGLVEGLQDLGAGGHHLRDVRDRRSGRDRDRSSTSTRSRGASRASSRSR